MQLRLEAVTLDLRSEISIATPQLDRTMVLRDLDWSPVGEEAATIPGIGAGVLSAEAADTAGTVDFADVPDPDGAGRGPVPALRCRREVFRAGAGRVAVRVCVRNDGHDEVALVAFGPVVTRSADAVRIGDVPVSEWVYMRQPRYKNDMPSAVRLGSAGPEVWDAARGMPETGGVPRTDEFSGPPTRFISADATVLTARGTSVLFGFAPLHRQFTRTVLDISEDRSALESFRAECLLDGVLLPPGECCESQWLVMEVGTSAADLLRGYADLLSEALVDRRESNAGFHVRYPRTGTALDVLAPADDETREVRKPPTVWCSWYYYGDGFGSDELDPNLTRLMRTPLPIDVIQIDECWDLNWGDWRANERWGCMRDHAARIRDMGYEPGLWTCPFVVAPRATLRYRHHDWLLRDRAGEYVRFRMNDADNYVLDPTHSDVLAFLRELYRTLTVDWGFTYHKLDFTRAVGREGVMYRDRTMTRASAYRGAMKVIREAIGNAGYLNVCGGFYGPLIGIADAQRTGSDVRSEWPSAPPGEEEHGYGPFTIKQNTLRFWMNRLWDNDPDALMVRRKRNPHRDEVLSLGRLTDEEALTTALNQFLAGGLVCFTENLAEVDHDRLMLLRHCSPSIGTAAVPLGLEDAPRFPSLFRTSVRPPTQALSPWVIISVVNWHDEDRYIDLVLDERALGPIHADNGSYLVSAFADTSARVEAAGATVTIGPVPAHGTSVRKVQPWSPHSPVVLSTDGHFSMGGTEIRTWEYRAGTLDVEFGWQWPVPLNVTVLPPAGAAFVGESADAPVTVRVDCSEPASLSVRLDVTTV